MLAHLVCALWFNKHILFIPRKVGKCNNFPFSAVRSRFFSHLLFFEVAYYMRQLQRFCHEYKRLISGVSRINIRFGGGLLSSQIRNLFRKTCDPNVEKCVFCMCEIAKSKAESSVCCSVVVPLKLCHEILPFNGHKERVYVCNAETFFVENDRKFFYI